MANTALVEPNILEWIRLERKFSVDELSQAANVTSEKYLEWEKGESKPTLRQLRQISNKCKLPLAIFFLSEPPSIQLPRYRDFRNIGLKFRNEAHESILNTEVQYALNQREVLLELDPDVSTRYSIIPNWESDTRSIEGIASDLRQLLGIDLDFQLKIKDPNKFFNFLRKKIEDLDILVFQTSELESEEFRALSIFNDTLPIILLNRKDAFAGRSFSLFHELAHILTRTNSICDLSQQSNDSIELEKKCNAIAANVLVPISHFRHTYEYLKWSRSLGEKADIIYLGKRYSVSPELIARKLLDDGLITLDMYLEFRKEFNEVFQESKSKKKSGFVPPAQDIVSLLGKETIGKYIQAIDSNKMSAVDFSEFTGVKMKHLASIRSKL